MVVFNDDYDKALWLMLVGDKENRKLLTNFIKVIPSKMYEYIQRCISLNKCYAHEGHSKTIHFEKQIMSDLEGYIYEFDSSISFGKLVIKMYRYPVDRNFEEFFELKLTPLGDSCFPYKLQCGEIENIGSFSYSNKRNNVFDSNSKSISYGREYSVKKKSFDRVSVCSVDSKFKTGKVLSMRDIPLNVGENIQLYKDSRDFSTLVRNRRRKKISINIGEFRRIYVI